MSKHIMPDYGIPYANQHMDDEGRVWVTCPACGAEIQLIERKDFESMTGSEYAAHFEAAAKKDGS